MPVLKIWSSDTNYEIANRTTSGFYEDLQAVANLLLVNDPMDEQQLSMTDLLGSNNDDEYLLTEIRRRIEAISSVVAEERDIISIDIESLETEGGDEYELTLLMRYPSRTLRGVIYG